MGRITSELKIVVNGLGFPEGPVALPDGRLAFADMRLQSVFAVSGSSATVIARTAGSPNGATLGWDGALYLANNGGVAPTSSEAMWYATPQVDGCIQRLTLEGDVGPVDTGLLPGGRPHRPNDICFGPDGFLYFTDPHNWEVLQSKTPDESTYRGGRLCRTDLRGTTEVLAELPGFPNGLAFTPDDAEIVVALTVHHRLVAVPIKRGAVGRPRVYCELPPGVNPDGMCFDTEGYLFVAGSAGDALVVVDPDGRVAELVAVPAGSCPTNLCLQDGRLWVTLGLAGALGFVSTLSLAHPLAAGRRPTQLPRT
jgi:sugar lactone lactonase YvrE